MGILLAITLISLQKPAQAVPVGCSSTSAITGSTTKVTFSTAGNCTWNVPASVRYIKFLIVAGGGGGGGGAYGGGGGGGAVIQSTSIAVTSGDVLNIQVGAGGSGGDASLNASHLNNEDVAGANGGDSYIGGYVAKGGGGGAGYYTAPFGSRVPAMGKIGGNQGGGSENSLGYQLAINYPTNQDLASALSATNRIEIYGNNFGGDTSGGSYLLAGAGGGGAGEPGSDVIAAANGGDGGDGMPTSFTGTSSYFGGGGGGGATNSGNSYSAGDGGLGGGGNGGVTGPGADGQTNTGGGGGGAGYNGSAQFGGDGGSGLIVISYRTDICIENGACEVGDEGPAAGIIFHIDTATNTAYEGAPRYWQSTCAAGGICNIGDPGFGGGPIFSANLGNYLEASPGTWQNSGNAFGTQFQYDAGQENTIYYSTTPGHYVSGRWRDASVADYLTMQKFLHRAGLHGPNASTQDDFYWTVDVDQQTNTPLVVNPRSGQVESALYPEYWIKLIGDYSSADSSEQYCDDNNWSGLVTGKAIGTGRANTALIVNSCVSGVAHIADALDLNSKSDWYLPSLEEMKALARQSSRFDGLIDSYWTSSTYEANRTDVAYYLQMSNPNQLFADYKFNGKGLRPIRSFSIAAASGPSISVSVSSGLRTAIFRSANTLVATTSTSGKVTFFADGKKIGGCISISTSANSAECTWKPSIRKPQKITAVLKTSDSSIVTVMAIEVAVVARSGRR